MCDLLISWNLFSVFNFPASVLGPCSFSITSSCTYRKLNKRIGCTFHCYFFCAMSQRSCFNQFSSVLFLQYFLWVLHNIVKSLRRLHINKGFLDSFFSCTIKTNKSTLNVMQVCVNEI